MVSEQLPPSPPPRKIVPRLGLGFRSRSGLVLGMGATRQLPPTKIVTRLGFGFGLGLVLGLGAIFFFFFFFFGGVGGNCPRTLNYKSTGKRIIEIISLMMEGKLLLCVFLGVDFKLLFGIRLHVLLKFSLQLQPRLIVRHQGDVE